MVFAFPHPLPGGKSVAQQKWPDNMQRKKDSPNQQHEWRRHEDDYVFLANQVGNIM